MLRTKRSPLSRWCTTKEPCCSHAQSSRPAGTSWRWTWMTWMRRRSWRHTRGASLWAALPYAPSAPRWPRGLGIPAGLFAPRSSQDMHTSTIVSCTSSLSSGLPAATVPHESAEITANQAITAKQLHEIAFHLNARSHASLDDSTATSGSLVLRGKQEVGLQPCMHSQSYCEDPNHYIPCLLISQLTQSALNLLLLFKLECPCGSYMHIVACAPQWQ